MKLSRVIITVFISTALSLFYVYQKTQLVRLSLDVHSTQDSLNYLIDQNRHIGYNNLALKSLDNIEYKLVAKNITLSRPQSWQVVSLRKQEAPPVRIAGIDFFSLLWPNAEAEQ